jgi:acyl carrier protein
MKDAEARIRRLLVELRPEADFDDASDFVGDGLLDSYDIVMLVAALDKEFSVSIDGAEIVPESFGSVAALVQLLRRSGASV